MRQFNIIWIGKTNDYNLKNCELDYIQRIKHSDKINIIELKDSKIQDIRQKLENEGFEIEKRIPKNSYLFVCDEKGKQFTSIEWSKHLDNLCLKGQQEFTFIIGSAYGLSERIKQSAHEQLAFSRMTFTHELIRVILLEQIYRHQTIRLNKSYHHE